MAKSKKKSAKPANRNAKPKEPQKRRSLVSAGTQQAQQRKRGSLREYFKGVRLEMKKVVWPTKQELGSYTGVVLLTCAFFALAFWLIDSGFLAILKGILGITLN